mmetsp:Transcript_6568/g.9544  ORF Transcript_6568/g.9544 Transcript_6568/m.9544 type:complete len:369 (+) Transcript_6568:43-1149(+)
MFRSEGKKGAEAKEQTKLKRKQGSADERLNRLLDPKVRKMGIDVQFLEAQKAEKAYQRELDAARDQYFDDQRLKDDEYAVFLENKRQQQRAQIEKDVQNYRNSQQKKEYQREWDLNDPNSLKNDEIGRVHDFHGEDLGFGERKSAQARQLTSWLKQQEKEKMENYAADRAKDLLWQEQQEMNNFLAEDMENDRQRLRAEKLRALKEFNMEQARAKRMRELVDREREDNERQWEIYNQMNSDLLNEKHDNSRSSTDPNRYQPSGFKGMSQEERDRIKAIQEDQIRQKKLADQRRKEQEEAEALQMIENDRTAMMLQRQQDRLRAQISKNLAETHKQQMEEQKYNKKVLDEIYAPKITEDFFSQFQNSDR